MPYTPPSRSPASSTPSSPDMSRRSSFHHSPNSSRTVLPRSASYLTKHRRTPSAPSVPRQVGAPSPESTMEDLKGMITSSSVRQSPPPMTGGRVIPNGAIISPPDSSSDDDDLPEVRTQTRGRQIESIQELHDAISQIPQDRSSSPDKGERSAESASVGDLLVLPSQASAIVEGSEEDTDDDTQRKPQMVRKKSGELVRPALRPPSRRRPSSMPGTPTFHKAVHFPTDLEQVRHFLQLDRPLAVSAGSSPVDNYESDTEYPFTGDDRQSARTPPFEWEIVMHNFPLETGARKAQPVRLERVWLSNDQQCLIGSVVVANLAFQKYVTCRFTLDYWKTTSEVAAEYVNEVLPAEQPVRRDRFQFTIKLSDLANLESKTLYFCIRYNVSGQEHWDNNNGMNFQADFRKKMLPQNGKKGIIGAASRPVNGLPKSTRRANPSTAPRPKSMPMGVDDFVDNPKLNFDQPLHDYLGESAPISMRLKGVKSTTNLPSDDLSSRLSAAPSGQAFAQRYDFGVSLTKAILNSKDLKDRDQPDGLYMKSSKNPTSTSSSAKPSAGPAPTTNNSVPAPSSKPTTAPGMDSPSPSISSSSYEELVHKYCFFGSKPTGPSRFDGADNGSRSTNSSTTASYEGSPVQIGNFHHYHSGTQHHTLHFNDPNPYFHNALTFPPIGASPAESPLKMANQSPAPSQETDGRSSPPTTSVADFAQFGPSTNGFVYQHMHDRFPFSGADAHAATAIRG